MRVLWIAPECSEKDFSRVPELVGRMGFSVRVIVPDGWREFCSDGSACTVRIKAFPGLIRHPVLLTYHPGQLLKECMHFRPHIILTSAEPYALSSLQLAFLKELAGAALIIRFADCTPSRKLPGVFRLIRRFVLSRADAAYSPSPKALLHLRSLGFSGAALLIGNPVPDRFFSPPKPSRGFVISFAGRFVPEKGISELLEVCSCLSSRFSSISLAAAGDGPLKGDIERSGSSFQVRTGRIERGKMQDFLGSGRVFVLLSRKIPGKLEEPFGRAAAEAAACSVVPVVSDAGGLPYAATDAGIAVKSPSDAFEAVSLLLSSPALRRKRGMICSALAEKFRAERIAGKFEKLLQHLKQKFHTVHSTEKIA